MADFIERLREIQILSHVVDELYKLSFARSKGLGAIMAKNRPPSQMQIKFSPKYVHYMCFSEINTIHQYIHLFADSGPTKLGNEKQSNSYF